MTTDKRTLRKGKPVAWAVGALVTSVDLSKEDARLLRTILLARYGKANKETVNAFFAGVIRAEWVAYDAMIQEAVELFSEEG